MATSPIEREKEGWLCKISDSDWPAQNLSKTFAGQWRISEVVARTTEKGRTAQPPASKKRGVERSCRASSGASAPERARREPQRTLFMTENELKKLVNEAVSLHRALTTYGERLKTLKGELVREAKRHKEDFIITDGGGSRWTASGTDGCIARINFPAPALLSHIATEDETFDKVLALAGESLDDLFESRHYLKPI